MNDEKQNSLIPKEQAFRTTSLKMPDLIGKVETLLDQSGRVAVTNDDDLAKAGDLVKFLNGVKADIEKERTNLVKPLNDVVKTINGQWKPWKDKIDGAVSKVKRLMTDYAREVERKKEAERKALAAQQEAEAVEMAAKLEEKGFNEAAEHMIDNQAKASTISEHTGGGHKVRGDYGSTTFTRKTLAFKVADETKIPREYLMLNEGKIKTIIKNTRDAATDMADEQGLKGKAKEAFINDELSKLAIDGLEFYFDISTGVR